MTYTGPDYGKFAMAKFLSEQASSGLVLPDSIARTVAWTLEQQASYEASTRRQRAAAEAKASELDTLLASDVKSGAPCTHTVYSGGSFRGHQCGRGNTYVRTWTTKEFVGRFLDGDALGSDDTVPGGWVLGKGFTRRELTEAEYGRIERRYEEKVHTAVLCGQHRKMAGQYGVPY